MTNDERARARDLIDAAPELSQEEFCEINGFFPAYIFRRSRTGEVWTSCCLSHGTPDISLPVMWAKHQREPKNGYEAPPQPSEVCPYCGAEVIIKELGRTGERYNLACWRRVVVLRWDGEALWARAYECRKYYHSKDRLTGWPEMELRGVYRFTPGLAEGATCGFNKSIWSYQFQDAPLKSRKRRIKGPFFCNAEQGMGYYLAGISEIGKSPFRYCGVEAFMDRHDGGYTLELLAACCFYPRQIEMLMKAGLQEAVWDLAARGVKNAAVIDWTKTGPDAVKIDRQRLKEFMRLDGGHRNMETLLIYKYFKGKFPITECADWATRGVDLKWVKKLAKKWNIPADKLMRYLAGQTVETGSIRATGNLWEDYLHVAQAIGDPLYRENVLMPRPLGPAHDDAVNRQRAQIERERRERQRVMDAIVRKDEKLIQKEYKKRRKKLKKKYAYRDGGFLIRVPKDADEIKAEGFALCHCVGGYADRHIAGATTILFMRREEAPDEPWLTIEMDKNAIEQIHGYRNEGMYTAKGRFAPDPRDVYRDWLEKWLRWLEAGSPRDREGNPVDIEHNAGAPAA